MRWTVNCGSGRGRGRQLRWRVTRSRAMRAAPRAPMVSGWSGRVISLPMASLRARTTPGLRATPPDMAMRRPLGFRSTRLTRDWVRAAMARLRPLAISARGVPSAMRETTSLSAWLEASVPRHKFVLILDGPFDRCLRCSSVKYTRYSPSSRLGIGRNSSPIMRTNL